MMKLSQRILHFGGWLFFERPWQSIDYTTLHRLLEQSGTTVVAGIHQANDTSANRDLIRHIIGIECWAQQRLSSLVNTQAYSAEYDALQPAATLTLAELADLMASTRAQSCAILQQLQQTGIALTQTVPHNQFGVLSIVAWNRYIASHALIELKKLAK
jgi:hypothetical protein